MRAAAQRLGAAHGGVDAVAACRVVRGRDDARVRAGRRRRRAASRAGWGRRAPRLRRRRRPGRRARRSLWTRSLTFGTDATHTRHTLLATFVFMSTKARANARAATPWGDAALVEQLELQQRAGESGSRRSSSCSRTRRGERLVRFAYTTDGSRAPRAGDAALARPRAPARRRSRSIPSSRRRSASEVMPRRVAASRSRAASTSDARISAPSAEPSSGSTACSGCGIRPMHVALRVARRRRRRATEPFGLLLVAQHDLARPSARA